MKFITLTSKDGLTPVYVNPDHIIYMMNDLDGRAVLHATPWVGNAATTLHVRERADEVIKMCEEAKNEIHRSNDCSDNS